MIFLRFPRFQHSFFVMNASSLIKINCANHVKWYYECARKEMSEKAAKKAIVKQVAKLVRKLGSGIVFSELNG